MLNFDLNLLISLDALLSEKNVTRAALRAHVTQSTMSGTLKRLRDQFDDQLLVRDGRRYELSPLAQSLAISVRQILLQIESTVSSRPLFDPATDTRRLRIMASDYGALICLAPVLRRVEKLAPNLSYDIVPIASPVDSVRSGAVDMCLTGAPDAGISTISDSLVRSDVVFREVFVCVVDGDHPLTGKVMLEQMFAYTHVVAQFAGVSMASDALRPSAGLTAANPTVRVPGFALVPSLVAGTRSIGIVPRRILDVTPDSDRLRILDIGFDMPRITGQLIWHSRLAYDPAFCWFRNVMLEMAPGR